MSDSIFLKNEFEIRKRKKNQQEILLPVFVKRQLKTYFLIFYFIVKFKELLYWKTNVKTEEN